MYNLLKVGNTVVKSLCFYLGILLFTRLEMMESTEAASSLAIWSGTNSIHLAIMQNPDDKLLHCNIQVFPVTF